MKRLASVFLSLNLILMFFPLKAKALDYPVVSAKGAVVMNADTGEVIFEKACHSKMSMASTTKIMTALILAEQPDLQKKIIVTKNMVTVEGSSMGLLPGDTVTLEGLLYGMLLASGNDAANTTAICIGGSVEGFVKLMNKRAAEIGMQNTSFETPSGLDSDNHYSTPYDMALLATVALKKPVFKAVCSSKTATLYYGNPPYRRSLSNHNKLLNAYEGAIGVKTGFTKKSGRCLVSAAEREGITLVAVTLNCPNDWQDHATLLDYGFSNTVKVSFDNTDILDSVPIITGDCDKARISAREVEFGITRSNMNRVVREVRLNNFYYSPLASGERVGSINFYLDNKLIKSVAIICEADVKSYNKKEPFKNRFIKYFKNMLIGC